MDHSPATLSPAPALTRGQSIGFGAVVIASGMIPVAIALGWVPSPAESFGAPRDVVLCTGLVFVIGGVLVAAGDRMPKWLGGFLGACVWTLFAIMPSWIAWGGGPREFSGDGLWLLSLLGLDTLSIGRLVFGLSALIMWVCTAFIWQHWLRSLPSKLRIPGALGLALIAVWFFLGAPSRARLRRSRKRTGPPCALPCSQTRGPRL